MHKRRVTKDAYNKSLALKAGAESKKASNFNGKTETKCYRYMISEKVRTHVPVPAIKKII
jgi:hypothetical protein